MLHVNVSPLSNSNQAQILINQILQLSVINNKALSTSFQLNDETEAINTHQSSYQDTYIQVSKKCLQNLKKQLIKTYQIVSNLSPTATNQIQQYSYLSKIWQKHFSSSTMSAQLTDRIDSISRTVSMLKQRTRNLVLLENQQRNKYWNLLYQAEKKCNYWDNPLFQVMNSKIVGLGMQCEDIKVQWAEFGEQNKQLKKKNCQMEIKIGGYKQKLKKMQKQMFQIAKKKSQLQKKLLQKQQISSQNKENTRVLNSIQKQPVLHSQYIMLLQQEQQENKRKELNLQKAESFNSASIREKYRNAKNLSRKSIAYISPNTSMDSIKSVKFERTCGKKLFVKGGA